MMKQKKIQLGMIICIVISSIPLFMNHLILGDDLLFHLTRIEGIYEEIRLGNIFPIRIQSYWIYGHGYAVSTFYGDLFLYVPALLRIAGLSIMTAYKVFIFIVNIATMCVVYMSFRNMCREKDIALFGSMLYILAPYRLYNIYCRGAVGEYLAMIFIPLVVSGMYGILTENVDGVGYGRIKWQLIIGLTGILQSHLITTEIAVIGIVLCCVICFKKVLRKKSFVQLAQAALIVLGLNSWFWVPLVVMMGQDTYLVNDIVKVSMQSMGANWNTMFLIFPKEHFYNAGALRIGFVSIAAFVLLIVTVLLFDYYLSNKDMLLKGKAAVPSKSNLKRVLLFAGLVILTLVMSTTLFPWDLLIEIPIVGQFLSVIQFPFRILSVASVFVSCLGMFCVLWIQEMQLQKIGKNLCVFLWICTAGIAVYQMTDLLLEREPYSIEGSEMLGTLQVANGEYLLKDAGSIEEYYEHGPLAEEGMLIVDYEKNGLKISMRVENQTDKDSCLQLPLIGYKGYKIATDGEGELPYISEERGIHGDLCIIVPKSYVGNIEIIYEGFTCYKIADTVSVLFVGAIIVSVLSKRRKIYD